MCEPRQQTTGLIAAAPTFYDGTVNVNGSTDTVFRLEEVANLAGDIVIPFT